MTVSIPRGALTAFALVLMSAPALAQAPMTAPADGARHQHMQEMMQQHHDAMAKDLHTILNIHPDQEAAFTAFIASMARPPHDGMKDHAAMMAMTTPQKLDMMLAHMTERMDRMRKHIEAVKTFYAALSPEQQKAFDALERLHGGMGGGMGRGMGGGHMGRGMGYGGMMHGPGEGPPPPSGE